MNEMNQQDLVVEEGITLAELFRIVWNNRLLVIFVTLWVFVIGVVYTWVGITPLYTAETSIMVQVDVTAQTSTSEQSAIYVAQNLISTYKEFVVTNLVLESVINDIPELTDVNINSLRNSISVSSATNVLIIYISVENASPELASLIADQLVENSIQIADDENNGYVLLQNKLKLLDVAQMPTAPSSPNKPLNLIISLLLGGILALGIVFVKELFNNKFQTTQELEKYLKVNVIAAVPGTIKERKLVD
ncbi:MAG: Wzz/FepE/Etk N-terminal domain-containing protein [Candidatus Izemoplasmatales bacterium]|jgi:capsular polysaccharide biosynthesis protein|nr:Wzz/FepE/Etk N-terminal domain-containing protein [Candidatus Izemoplasmatales bacterium]